MANNLVIVESPAKAKTIENFLGKQFLVKSCFGHIRDLSKKQLGVDVKKGFTPNYIISEDKVKVINELKKSVKSAETVWLATDEDREGEAISWHLYETLNLKKKDTKRIVFHEITKSAITDAINKPRDIDLNLVDAQQARRVLDRLVGFELSPVLWRKVKPALSAGRVQSVAVRLIVEREEEIKNFTVKKYYKITSDFIIGGDKSYPLLKAELPSRLDSKEKAIAFLKKCIGADFTVGAVEKKPAQKSPAPPFTTSTLQQEASRKLGFSVSKTMMVAQRLYESGKITYMRTDSVNLSNLALSLAKEEILKSYGEKYLKTRKYATKSKGAQEAHEAIRPTYLNMPAIIGTNDQKKLYTLIWKRTIASQMSNALLEKTNVTINISGAEEKFVAKGEVIIFDGFLKVYFESANEENSEEKRGMLPPLKVGESLLLKIINATEKFTQPPKRYSEASLVKKLEELGIGRPSTYAPIISTIQKREYVVKKDREAVIRNYTQITLQNNKISEVNKTEKTGQVKAKLFPTDIGTVVNKFLLQHFQNIMDYNFTASVEKEFDEIALGKKIWNKMIGDFYWPFHKKVENTIEKSSKFSGEKLLGTEPETGKNIYVKIGRFGPMAQIGNSESEEKPRFASLKKGQSLETITLQEVLDLFKFPRNIGNYENEELTVAIGRFGPYVKHKSNFYSIGKENDPLTIEKNKAIEIIEAKRKKDREKIIKVFEADKDVQVLNGRWGAYISVNKINYRIPKNTDASKLSLDECRKIIESAGKKKNSKTTISGRKPSRAKSKK